MHNYFFILFLSLFASKYDQENISVIELHDWRFQLENQWYNAIVPGNNFSDLLNHNIIKDPFYATNEDSINWVSKKEWIYKSNFSVPKEELKKQNHELIFYGLDTYTKIFLNDILILETDNMFQKWQINISENLQENNTLKIHFLPVESIEKEKEENLGYKLPGGSRVHTRKAAFHYGWDWGPKISTSGIWRKVQLIHWDNLRINDVAISQESLSDSICELSIRMKISSNQEKDIQIKINNQKTNLQIEKGNQEVDITYTIKNPELWWPTGYGKQKLYDISIQILEKNNIIDSKTKKIGIRNIDLITEKDSIGESFYFKVNGTPIFIKGSNYIPQDNLQNRVSYNDYLSLLLDVKNANMNMIRVWGGGIYEQDIFYNLCDSLGILVWQDFMFACAMYPSDSLFLNSIEKEAIYNVQRLSHHPSIALWCGNNENSEGWHRWGWQNDFSSSEEKEIWDGYKKIFQDILPKVVNEFSQNNYWESSPKLGRGDPKHQFEGDAHYWGVWHDSEPFEMLELKVPRFMSEYGFQSMPEIETISKFADSSQWHINSPSLLNHQKHPRGNALILEYMSREYKIPKNFEKYIYCNQILQAEGIRLGIEAHRREKPICMGTLYWQLNDCWPGISWSSRDYFGNWKALHYAVQDAYAPLFISIYKNKNGEIQIYGISDLKNNIKDTLEVKIYKINGELKDSYYKQVNIKSNSSSLLFSEENNLESDEFMIASLKNNNIRSKVLFPTEIKNVHFIDPQITYEWKDNYLTVSSKTAAFQVYLHGLDTHLSDNFFNLIQGEKKEIKVSGNDFEKNNLVIWSLYDLNK